MKLVIAGAFGNLGAEITKAAVMAGHEVLAADRILKAIPGLSPDSYRTREIDVTKPDTLAGLCEGADMVITTVGLTASSKTVTHYDIDLAGNINLLEEAKRRGVRKFVYTSVIKADTDASIPMLDAKASFEKVLKASGLEYLIVRPSGYFYDIAKVFAPMVEKGSVTLLKGVSSRANVIATQDLAEYLLTYSGAWNTTVEIGGTEVYTYEEIAAMFFAAAGKPCVIKYAPAFLFDILAFVAKLRRNGKYASIRFGKWTLVNNMEAAVKYGKSSFKQYIAELFSGRNK